MQSYDSAGIIIFSLYLIVILLIGFISARFQRTSEDFWVGGRRFGLPVMVLSNMASIMHGGSILSGIAVIGQFGAGSIPFLSFAAGTACILFFFAKKLRRSRGFTLPDYMGDRFDSRFLRAWSALVVAVSSIIYLMAQIRGMGFVLETLLGVPFFWGMVIGVLVFVVYVVMGGLMAVVWTNVAQAIFMWTGLFVLAPAVYRLVGGWSDVMIRANELSPGWTSLVGLGWTPTYTLSWYVVWFVAYATRMELITKMFAARDDKIARYSLPWTILMVMIFLLYGNFYLGGAARILVWDEISTPDAAFTALVTKAITPLLAAFALTGIASAAMSTSDSLLLLSGAALSHDFLRRSIHEPRGILKDEKYYLRVSRCTIAVVGLIAFLGALPDWALILQIVSYALAILGSTFFFPLFVGLTSKKVGKEAAISSSVGGFVCSAGWMVALMSGYPWARAIHPIIPGLVASGALMLLAGFFSSSAPKRSLAKFFPEEA